MDKEIRNGLFCSSVLSKVILNANGGHFAEIDVVNEFNKDVYYDYPRPVASEFQFLDCSQRLGCGHLQERMDIDFDFMNIIIK